MRGGDLVCPKCNRQLRHIGVDYEKPSKLFTCFNCEIYCPEKIVDVHPVVKNRPRPW